MKNSKRTPKLALIGIGPHSKRIYLHALLKHGFLPSLIVDLESKKKEITKCLARKRINAELFLVPDKQKDREYLEKQTALLLKEKIKQLKISHAIISTEPKAHFAYLKFFLENNVNVLCDKPISVLKDMHLEKSAKRIKEQFEELAKIYKKKKGKVCCRIQCQRRNHKGYVFVKKLLAETIKKYNIPITFISIYHCDGKWMLPHDLDCENHPFKYGYGKLFHSGYHFIDLLGELIKLNKQLSVEKRIHNVDISSYVVNPTDEMVWITKKDLKKLFQKQMIPKFYDNYDKKDYIKYGEKDYHSLMQFRDKNGNTITTASLNLMQTGFSRRSWIKCRNDTYKGNGRVRHENINIQLGPLMNIQIHSYQSKEIRHRKKLEKEISPGGLEHFDIYIFRNSGLIGGKPFEKISLKEIYQASHKKFIGYNELAREEAVISFIKNTGQENDLLEHKLGIELLYFACLAASKLHKNKRWHRKNFELKEFK